MCAVTMVSKDLICHHSFTITGMKLKKINTRHIIMFQAHEQLYVFTIICATVKVNFVQVRSRIKGQFSTNYMAVITHA